MLDKEKSSTTCPEWQASYETYVGACNLISKERLPPPGFETKYLP